MFGISPECVIFLKEKNARRESKRHTVEQPQEEKITYNSHLSNYAKTHCLLS
jgi:hypothetical protein